MEHFTEVKTARAHKCNDVDRDAGVRLYCTMYNTAWELQVRCPLGIGTFGTKQGKDFIIAGASLSTKQMKELRDAIDAALSEAERIAA